MLESKHAMADFKYTVFDEVGSISEKAWEYLKGAPSMLPKKGKKVSIWWARCLAKAKKKGKAKRG